MADTPDLSVRLTQRDKEFVEQQVEAGLYDNAEEVVSAGLKALDSEDYKKSQLLHQIDAADDQFARGEFLTLTTAQELAESIKERGRKILAERR